MAECRHRLALLRTTVPGVSEWSRELADLDDAEPVFVGPVTVSVWAVKQ